MNKVLIVEDDRVARQQLSQLFRFENFEVIDAASGEAGIAALDSPPDLVVCDIMMPGVDGFGVLQALRNNPSTALTPFIFLTAKAAGQDVRQGMGEGADDYITKPFEPESLLASVRQRIERRRLQKEEAERQSAATGMLAAAVLPREIEGCLEHLERIANLLAARCERNVIAAELPNAIESEVSRLRNLTRRLRIYGELPSLYAGRFSERPADFSVCPIDVAVAAVRETAERWNRTGDLTVSAEGGNVLIPGEALTIIVSELADNACKFSPASTSIFFQARQERACWRLTVSNHGAGMSPAQIREIGAFKQFWSGEERPKGVGLGLVLVQALARMHSGEFQIESGSSRATSATVMVPAE